MNIKPSELQQLDWREHRGPAPSIETVRSQYVYLFHGRDRGGFEAMFFYLPAEQVFMKSEIFALMRPDEPRAFHWFTARLP